MITQQDACQLTSTYNFRKGKRNSIRILQRNNKSFVNIIDDWIQVIIIYPLTFFIYTKSKCSVQTLNIWRDIPRSWDIAMQWNPFDLRMIECYVYVHFGYRKWRESFKSKKNCELVGSESKMARFYIILSRVNNINIKQKRYEIFVLLYATNTNKIWKDKG